MPLHSPDAGAQADINYLYPAEDRLYAHNCSRIWSKVHIPAHHGNTPELEALTMHCAEFGSEMGIHREDPRLLGALAHRFCRIFRLTDSRGCFRPQV